MAEKEGHRAVSVMNCSAFSIATSRARATFLLLISLTPILSHPAYAHPRRGLLSCACVCLHVPFDQVPRKSLAGFQGGQAYVGKDGKSYGLLVPYRHSFPPLGGANSKLTADGFNALDVMREVCTYVGRRVNLRLPSLHTCALILLAWYA